MNSKEVIKKIMHENGERQCSLSKRLGVSQTTLWNRLNDPKTKTLKVSTACDTLRALGYSLVAVPDDIAVSLMDDDQCYLVCDSDEERKPAKIEEKFEDPFDFDDDFDD